MAKRNLLCAMCCERISTLYCPCGGSKMNLCGPCVGLHMEKYPQRRHVMSSIDASADDSAAYLQEIARFEAGKTELEQIQAKIDQCCYELNESVEFVVAKLTAYRDECVSQLQAWKASLSIEIAEAVEEVQAALSGGKAEFRNKLSYSLKNFKPGSFDSLSSLVDIELRHSQGVIGTWEWAHQYLVQFRSQEICRIKREEAKEAARTDPSRIVYADCDEGVYEFTHVENGLPLGRQLYQFGGKQDVDKPYIDYGSSYTLLDAERLISCVIRTQIR